MINNEVLLYFNLVANGKGYVLFTQNQKVDETKDLTMCYVSTASIVSGSSEIISDEEYAMVKSVLGKIRNGEDISGEVQFNSLDGINLDCNVDVSRKLGLSVVDMQKFRDVQIENTKKALTENEPIIGTQSESVPEQTFFNNEVIDDAGAEQMVEPSIVPEMAVPSTVEQPNLNSEMSSVNIFENPITPAINEVAMPINSDIPVNQELQEEISNVSTDSVILDEETEIVNNASTFGETLSSGNAETTETSEIHKTLNNENSNVEEVSNNNDNIDMNVISRYLININEQLKNIVELVSQLQDQINKKNAIAIAQGIVKEEPMQTVAEQIPQEGPATDNVVDYDATLSETSNDSLTPYVVNNDQYSDNLDSNIDDLIVTPEKFGYSAKQAA